MVISFNLPTKSAKSIIISSSLEMDTKAEGHCFLVAKLGFETRSFEVPSSACDHPSGHEPCFFL